MLEQRTYTQPWFKDTTYQGGTLHYNELDGQRIAYHSGTQFLVQVAKGKGSYRTKYDIKGDLPKAVRYYTCINIGRGYRKRLVMPSCSHKPILARSTG